MGGRTADTLSCQLPVQLLRNVLRREDAAPRLNRLLPCAAGPLRSNANSARDCLQGSHPLGGRTSPAGRSEEVLR